MKKLTSKEDLLNLLTASVPSLALGAAIETGLLEMLAEKPMSGEEVSRAMNIPGKRGYYWLQFLAELGILDIDQQGYGTSSLARNAILDVEDFRRLRIQHSIADERDLLAGVRNLALYMSEPSIWKAQGLREPKGYVEKMNDNPERAYSFARLLYNVHQNLGNVLARFLDLTNVHTLMDVGGGSGVVAMALARKYPGLSITTVDIENVCNEGRVIVEENNLSDRITFHAADFVRDELPKGFDFVLHCDVGVYDVEHFRKLLASLKPEGRIAVIFHFPLLENSAPVQFLEWAFLDSMKDPEFGFPTVSQLQDRLVQAGFKLSSEAPSILDGYDGFVIQAHK